MLFYEHFDPQPEENPLINYENQTQHQTSRRTICHALVQLPVRPARSTRIHHGGKYWTCLVYIGRDDVSTFNNGHHTDKESGRQHDSTTFCWRCWILMHVGWLLLEFWIVSRTTPFWLINSLLWWNFRPQHVLCCLVCFGDAVDVDKWKRRIQVSVNICKQMAPMSISLLFPK